MHVAEVLCQPLQLVSNATMDGNGTGLGAIITYSCWSERRFLDGYETKTVRCQDDEQWNETLTTCEGRTHNATQHINTKRLCHFFFHWQPWLLSCLLDVRLYMSVHPPICLCLSVSLSCLYVYVSVGVAADVPIQYSSGALLIANVLFTRRAFVKYLKCAAI